MPDLVELFSSCNELTRLAAKWPASRLTEIWNTLPDVTRVKKFRDRKASVSRIWQAIQGLVPDSGAHVPRVGLKKAGPGTPATKGRKAPVARDGSKKAQVLDLLQRPGGTSLKKLMAMTGWQAHSVRGFISGALGKKMGHGPEPRAATFGVSCYRNNATALQSNTSSLPLLKARRSRP